MFDEAGFINRVEKSDIDEFTRLISQPKAEEEQALRKYFGDYRYQRMHGAALKRFSLRESKDIIGNVIVLHGILGSELTSFHKTPPDHELIWINFWRILQGQLDRLCLSADGLSDRDSCCTVRPTGMFKRYYGELLLSLRAEWNVQEFCYDWRKDIFQSASELEAMINRTYGKGVPLHLIAHSMGGLVARAYILRYRSHWNELYDQAHPEKGGRLIMLGTPNRGSFTIPQVMTGLDETVIKLSRLDLKHSLTDVVAILNTFAGIYQMLPAPGDHYGFLYDANTYKPNSVSQTHLTNALHFHEEMQKIIDPERMVYIAGYNQLTYDGIPDQSSVSNGKTYTVTLKGDGRVPHSLGLLDGVHTYYVNENHGNLPANPQVLEALSALLRTGQPKEGWTGTFLPEARFVAESPDKLGEHMQAAREARIKDFEYLKLHADQRGLSAAEAVPFNIDERLLGEHLLQGFLAAPDHAPALETDKLTEESPGADGSMPKIVISVIYDSIDKIDAGNAKPIPIDALAVGHYIGTMPQDAALALDIAISPVKHTNGATGTTDATDFNRLLSQYAERGVIRGELGRLFFFPDPRKDAQRKLQPLIAIAGMGFPGRFGAPELTVLARELCWALGCLGKHHLATVLIGAGKNNLPVAAAIPAWLGGIRLALLDHKPGLNAPLTHVTFVESDPTQLKAIDLTLRHLAEELRTVGQLDITYVSTQIDPVLQDLDKQKKYGKAPKNPQIEEIEQTIPTRLTITFEQGQYRISAITKDAAVPERILMIDPLLVARANDELAGEMDARLQVERGQFLERLLIPCEFREHLKGATPLVLMLDATTARIHWEMLAQISSLWMIQDRRGKRENYEDNFLGTSRGLTRQLKTTFASLPEPPPIRKKVIRVLIVADPAEDARLRGAEREGIEIVDHFTSREKEFLDQVGIRLEVTGLFGPNQATRTTVMRLLTLHKFDILHYAGHCVYDEKAPEKSGWIFSNGERLTANELSRIDRVPSFIFSNACESGITPDRSGMRSPGLAPSFAEAFFAQGVSNLVCTAWPVDDYVACNFAKSLYEKLLEFQDNERYIATNYICDAMHSARKIAAELLILVQLIS